MLITLKNKDSGKLVVKDMLDIDFDMSVEEVGSKYYVSINRRYRDSEEFHSEAEAEDRMIWIMETRNKLEYELSQY